MYHQKTPWDDETEVEVRYLVNIGYSLSEIAVMVNIDTTRLSNKNREFKQKGLPVMWCGNLMHERSRKEIAEKTKKFYRTTVSKKYRCKKITWSSINAATPIDYT